MATYRITSPDGEAFEITAPDDATEAQVMDYAKKQFSAQKALEQQQRIDAQMDAQTGSLDPTANLSGTDKFLAGMGKGFMDVGRGVGQLVGAVDQSEIDTIKQRDAPLMESGAGLAGNITGNIAAAAPAMFIPGANTAVGAGLVGAGLGLAQPVGSDDSRLANVALGGAGGAGGQMLGKAIGGLASSNLAKKTAAAAAQKTQNTVKDAAAAMGRAEGYVIPPTQANPTVLNRALEGLAGKLTTGQQASIKNQGVTNALAKKALGMTDDSGLTVDALKAIRENAGQSYETLKGIGRLQSDGTFAKRLGSLTEAFDDAAKDFPELARDDVTKAIRGLQKPDFDARSAVAAIRVMRDKADRAYAGADKEAGKAFKGAADAIEDLIERNLESTGNKGLLTQFRDARKLIAKTYTVEKALNQSTGNVNAQKLAKALERGKPLDKELKKAASFAQAFPKAAQEIGSSMPGVSPLDFATGGMMSATAGNPAMMGSVITRPLARNLILSNPYQNAMTTPSYQAGRLSRAAPGLLDTDEAAALAGLLGARGSIQAVQ